jgi:hypothetical protein
MNCLYCDKIFTRKDSLKKHIVNKRCSLINVDKLWDCHEALYGRLNVTSNTVVNNGTINNIQNIQIININPSTKLNVEHLKTDHMKKLIESYSGAKSNLLLSGYIKNIIHNKDHPENHCVKYVSKRPPTFSSVIEEDGENKMLIKNLKDSCELLSDPILTTLRKKLRDCNKTLKNDEEFQDNYEDVIQDIYRELNKDAVKKALSTVLQNDILNDIDMACNKGPTTSVK